MPESLVQVTSGAGPKLHTWQYTVGANNVEQEFGLPGEYPYPTYSVVATNVSVATTADHLLQLMAGASLRVRLRRIWISQLTIVTTAAQLYLEVLRLTTAGTGGGVVTPRPFDTNDAAAGFTAMTLPTAKGTEGVQLLRRTFNLNQALSTTATNLSAWVEYVQMPNEKPIIIPAGTANGIALKVTTGRAGATVDIVAELVETSF